MVQTQLGLKAPKGFGWITNPKKYAYNKVYNKTSSGCVVIVLILLAIGVGAVVELVRFI